MSKAMRIYNNGLVTPLGSGMFRVDPLPQNSQVHNVQMDENGGQCLGKCDGYARNGFCSHVGAVKIYINQSLRRGKNLNSFPIYNNYG